LFAEKPLAMVRDEARELLRLADSGKTPFGISFNHRFAYHSSMAWWLGMEQLGRALTPCGSSLAVTGRVAALLAHLIYMQSHGFNMLTTFCGPVRDVTCVAAAPRDEDSLTTATVTMRFEQGGVGVWSRASTRVTVFAHPQLRAGRVGRADIGG
jgi:predicted dehydrogenase